MKAGTSSLNPYAQSYIPLSRRGATDGNKDSKFTAKDSRSGNENIWLGFHSQHRTENQLKSKASQNVHAYGSSPRYRSVVTEKQTLDEEFVMDLAYLQMTFPGISEESLSDVYLANKGDLEAAIEMLSQLELYTDGSSENLPDTLDIGDVSEPGSSSESAFLNPKKAGSEVRNFSSGSPNSAFVT